MLVLVDLYAGIFAVAIPAGLDSRTKRGIFLDSPFGFSFFVIKNMVKIFDFSAKDFSFDVFHD
jgi:hypothetical protein